MKKAKYLGKEVIAEAGDILGDNLVLYCKIMHVKDVLLWRVDEVRVWLDLQ